VRTLPLVGLAGTTAPRIQRLCHPLQRTGAAGGSDRHCYRGVSTGQTRNVVRLLTARAAPA